MKDFLLNENFSMMGIPSDHLIPLDSTGVSIMSRTIQMSFNKQNRTFELGYLNYEVDKSVRYSIVHCYYLSIDTRLSHFIEFLVSVSPEQERQSKINNIRQIVLKVTVSRKGQVFYNLIIRGDSTGVMTFKPSEFKNLEHDVDLDLSSMESLVNSIINEEEESTKLSFYVHDPAKSVNQLTGFRIKYTDYEYFKGRKYHVYDIVLDEAFFELLEFLRISYSRKNQIKGEVEKVFLRIDERKQIASLFLYCRDTDVQDYERIDFTPTLLKDFSDESRNLPKFPRIRHDEKEQVPDIKQQILTICQEIVNTRTETTQKIDQLRQLVNSLDPTLEEKSKKVKETIHRVYKRDVNNSTYIHVGTRTSNDEVVFRLPIWSESRRKDLQKAWNIYDYSFYCQTTWVYDDGTTKVEQMKEFTPTNNIQQFESSNRKGVIGYVEQVAGLVEVIYYDRFAQ